MCIKNNGFFLLGRITKWNVDEHPNIKEGNYLHCQKTKIHFLYLKYNPSFKLYEPPTDVNN
jgi:hypothetical protein